ncbi:MAG: hypothetical protein KTR18_03970 [Acidiferrobacterales bacterium]|nr:hypothetical protein [Acidiferrobacterales bacterium]
MTLVTKSGIFLSLFSVIAWAADRFGGHMISTQIGKWICGDQYLQLVDGVLSSQSCGFNTDLHLTGLLFLALVVGILLSLTTTVLFRGNAYL